MSKRPFPHSVFARSVVALLSMLMSVGSSFYAVTATRATAMAVFPMATVLALAFSDLKAGPFEDAAKAGKDLGKAERSNIMPPTANQGAGSFTINSPKPSVNGTSFTINQLFPGGASGQSSTQLNSATATYGNPAAMQSEANSQNAGLMDTANTTPWANAYRTLRDAAINVKNSPSLLNDPIRSGHVGAIDPKDPNSTINSLAGPCVVVRTPVDTATPIHSPDLRRCERPANSAAPECKLIRNFTTTGSGQSLLAEFSLVGTRQFSVAMMVVNQFGVPITFGPQPFGTVSTADYWLNAIGDSVTSTPFSGTIDPLSTVEWPPAAIAAASINIQVDPPGSGAVVQIDTLPSNHPFQWLVFSVSTSGYQDLVVRVSISNETFSDNGIVDSPLGCSTSFASCTALVDPAWSMGPSLEEQASDAVWRCTEAYTSRTFGSVTITSADVPPLFPGSPAYPAPVCFQAVARNYQCTGPGGSSAACNQLGSNPACTYISTQCEDVNKDPVTGQCALLTDTYDCGTTVSVSTTTAGQQTFCGGPIRCMGTDCVGEDAPESNPDFKRVVTGTAVNQWGQMDADCNAAGCVLFKGEGYDCKIAVFGAQDCCDQPVSTTAADYLKFVYYTWKASDRQAILSFMESAGLDVAGAWDAVSNFASSTWSSISEPFISAWESVARDVSLDAASTLSLEAAKEAFMSALSDWVTANFGPSVGSALFTTTTNQAGQTVTSFSPQLMSAFNFVMTVYMYYVIAMLIIQIVFACTESEFELAAKRSQKLCRYLGKYCKTKILGICIEKRDSFCCYKSPLARILHQQIGPSVSPAAAPSCPGINAADLANVNWDTVDLSEWLALLAEAGLAAGDAGSADGLYAASRIQSLVMPNGPIGGSTSSNVAQGFAAGPSAQNPENARQFIRGGLWSLYP